MAIQLARHALLYLGKYKLAQNMSDIKYSWFILIVEL